METKTQLAPPICTAADDEITILGDKQWDLTGQKFKNLF
jgi:hypothetical protein